jgi:hypothetical protein
MADLFYSPRLTFVRAQHHVRDFKETVNRFIAEKPWTRFVDKDSDPGKDVHKIKFTQQMPEMLPCILFDATNNLRAVLDQAGYASAVAGKSPSTKAIKFPFGPTEKKWRDNLAGGCKDLPAEIRTIFESFKAYKGGNDTLWAVNEIANANKHLALKPLVIANPSAFFSGRITTRKLTAHVVNPRGVGIGWDSGKNEITLMSVLPGTQADINTNITFAVAIDGVETLGGQPAVGVLHSMARIVERILVATEAKCRSLGFQLD